LYADDLQLYINFSCKPEDIAKCVSLVNDILADIVNWSARQGLKLNPNKSQAMIIGSERAHMKLDFNQFPKVALDGVTLEYTWRYSIKCRIDF
jgi:hypothetical protein